MIFAKEYRAPYKILSEDNDVPIYARIDVDNHQDLVDFFKKGCSSFIPVIWKNDLDVHPTRFNDDFFSKLVLEHIAVGEKLAAANCQCVVIAADQDGALQKILSPRFNQCDLNRRKKPLLEIFKRLNEFFRDVIVLLNVEELCPGGFDASDGVRVSQDLEALGCKKIIAASGTQDFMPLYDRRATQKKAIHQQEFLSHEPSLASAIWLVEKTNLDVSCLLSIDHRSHASFVASRLGISCLIEKAQTIDTKNI